MCNLPNVFTYKAHEVRDEYYIKYYWDNKKLTTIGFIVITISYEEHKSFLADVKNGNTI